MFTQLSSTRIASQHHQNTFYLLTEWVDSYGIKKYECTCPGFKYHGSCSHCKLQTELPIPQIQKPKRKYTKRSKRTWTVNITIQQMVTA